MASSPGGGNDGKNNGSVGKYAGLAILLPISTVVGFGLGYLIDMPFHTHWIRYVGCVLGTIAGFVDLLRELNKDL